MLVNYRAAVFAEKNKKKSDGKFSKTCIATQFIKRGKRYLVGLRTPETPFRIRSFFARKGEIWISPNLHTFQNWGVHARP